MLQSFLSRIVKIRFFGKSPVNAFLRLNRRVWRYFHPSLTTHGPIYSYGNLLHTLVRLKATRTSNFGTFFLRNRPQLELIRRLSNQKEEGSNLKITILACSKGAEVYSVVWAIRSTRPDLIIIMHAVDISNEILEFAQKGVYSLTAPEFAYVPIFERMSNEEMRDMFDIVENRANIKSWIKDRIIWHLGDVGGPEIVNILGPQDIVVANNFLCHMNSPEAERCLRNIGRLVKPGGYLIVSGIDLDIRTKVARDLKWKPISDLMDEIHEGDISLRRDWPWEWWGLEPLNKRRHNWEIRYASVFQLGHA